MLNQFMQNCIHTRNVGAVAIGCWIDGVISVVNDALGHVTRLTRHLTNWALRPERHAGKRHLKLIDRHRYLRLQPAIAPYFGRQWRQG